MKCHENGAALCVCQGRAVIERGVFIPAAGLQYLIALRFQCTSDLHREIQQQIAFANSLCTTRAGIGTAVRWIDHDNIDANSGLWNSRIGRSDDWARLLSKGTFAVSSLRQLRV